MTNVDPPSSNWNRGLAETSIVLGWTVAGAVAGWWWGTVSVVDWLGGWSLATGIVGGIVLGAMAGFLHLAIHRLPAIRRNRREMEIRRHESLQDAVDIAVAEHREPQGEKPEH